MNWVLILLPRFFAPKSLSLDALTSATQPNVDLYKLRGAGSSADVPGGSPRSNAVARRNNPVRPRLASRVADLPALLLSVQEGLPAD